MILRYVGPTNDSSGYSTAARNNIAAMIQNNIELTVHPTSFERQYTNHGKLSKLVNSYIGVRKKWDINLIHLTPENWDKFIDKSKYNIGFTVWETSKLPDSWIPLINKVNEVWVPSEWNKQLFIESGIKIPIKVVPHTLDISLPQQQYNTSSFDNHSYKFYSIFQWSARKNPEALLKAYLTEFTKEDNVTLILKTYLMNWNLDQQTQIKNKVKTIKEALGLENYPAIQFIGNLLPGDDIYSIHSVANCLVSPHKGEGSGLTIMESMLFGKPTISTNWSGNLEFANKDNAYLLDYTFSHVSGMPWENIYTRDQYWAEVDINDLKAKMRYVYEHQEEAKQLGLKAQKDIINKYSYEVIGNKIKQLLGEINA